MPILPFIGTSFPLCAHLPLHRYILFKPGTENEVQKRAPDGKTRSKNESLEPSPSWPHLALHGHIFPFMGTHTPGSGGESKNRSADRKCFLKPVEHKVAHAPDSMSKPPHVQNGAHAPGIISKAPHVQSGAESKNRPADGNWCPDHPQTPGRFSKE